MGMRDVNKLERDRVNGLKMGVIWGGEEVDFVSGLREELEKRFESEL